MRRDVKNPVTGNWTGIVNFINHDKGYGFIANDEFKNGLFFHARDCDIDFQYLKKGATVSFTTVFETDKGMSAADITTT